jgi:oligopeptidase B
VTLGARPPADLPPVARAGGRLAAAAASAVQPRAACHPHTVPSPHGARDDEYFWMRDDTRESPEVLTHLAAENSYADALLAPLAPLIEELYTEITARIRPDDASVPYSKRGYWYYTRYDAGGEYPIYARRRESLSAPEEIMLDVNALAAGHDFFEVADLAVSPDGRRLAWAEDAIGRRQYRIRVKDLGTGEVTDLAIANAEPGIEWAGDSRTFLYIEKDPKTLLGYRVRKHRLGSDPADDPLVWEQTDPSFYTDLARTKDDRYLVIDTRSTVASESWYADADDPELRFERFLARERDHEYEIEHLGDRWIVRTNWQARNFRVVEVAYGDEQERDRWRDVVPHDPSGFLHGFEVFRRFLAVEERADGLRRVRIRPWDRTLADTVLGAEEPACTTQLGQNEEFDSELLRYVYSSFTTPRTTYDHDLRSGTRTLLKREAVLGDFDPACYASEYRWVEARDGTRVPVSLVYRRETPRDGTAPLLQYAYGSYGLSQDPLFSVALLSLLDRGFVYALAHVRGGQELGREWYEAGKLLHKMNTFTDFIDVTAWLVEHRYADPARVFARGGSAGGLAVTAVANLAPAAYRGIVAVVPFVDIVTTMLDTSIPLTTNEFDEWGNPEERRYYDYMLGYSPYDNLAAVDYPAMYVFTGLWDSQVQYFEPAKYVARLRARRLNDPPLIFRIDMDAGHGGKSGRFQRYRELAEQYAFLLDLAGSRPVS